MNRTNLISILIPIVLFASLVSIGHADPYALFDPDFNYQACSGSPCSTSLSPWVMYTWTANCGVPSSQVHWSADFINGSAQSSQCNGASGWKASYQPYISSLGRSHMCWGCTSNFEYQYGINLNPPTNSNYWDGWPYIGFNSQIKLTQDSNIQNGYEDIFVDFWIYWTSPVGPNHFQYMEFMIQMESSKCNSTFGCPSDFYGTASNAYQYFHYVHWPDLNSWDYYRFTGTDIGNLLNNAFNNWSLPHANGWIIGIDIGQEAISQSNLATGSGAASLDWLVVTDCPVLNPGYIGVNLSC